MKIVRRLAFDRLVIARLRRLASIAASRASEIPQMAVPFSTHALHAARTLARFSIAAVVLALPYGHAGADLTYVRVARVQVEEIDTRREIVHETPDTGFVTTNTATSFRDVQTATGGVRLIDTNTGRPINVSDEAASASIAGHLDYGRIGVTAQTRAAVSRLGFPFQHVEASAASLTAWFDSITFTADTLPGERCSRSGYRRRSTIR